jgi:hypothetical protein
MIAARPLSELRHDDRGAVLMTGLFMSCFLIGALWFIIGIGDTIVFRDMMQEAVDHGAFASAALNAKGMNFIALCNLVLLAAVTIHIVLGIAHDIALVVCLASLGTSCGVWANMRRVYTGYFKVLKPAAKAIHSAEVVAAHAYPVMGFVEGMQIGRSYGGRGGTGPVTVLPLSRSLLPGGNSGTTEMVSQGLPVIARPMSFLCKKIASVGINAVFTDALGVSRSGASGALLDRAKQLIGASLEARYCNGGGMGSAVVGAQIEQAQRTDDEKKKAPQAEDAKKPSQKKSDASHGSAAGGVDPGFDAFWGADGPLVVVGGAGNGTKYFQTQAINLAPSMKDASESRVGIARGTRLGMSRYELSVRPVGYFAQAEFYFDCDQTWSAPNCNDEDNATFQIKWRARLRKLALPKVIAALVNQGPTALPSPGQLQAATSNGLFESGGGTGTMQSFAPLLSLLPIHDASGLEDAEVGP